MELAAPIWDAIKCLCDCSAKHAALICHVEENLQSLIEHWTQLQDRSEDVKLMVQQAESKPHMVRTREVRRWLQRADNVKETIEDIIKRGDKVVRDKCLGKFCHKNCLSSYNFGKEVVENLDLVKKLLFEGEKFSSTNIAYELPRNPAEEMPIPKTVGMDVMLKKICGSIEEENVGIIGLYGMGGVGKTTLLKKVNNELAKRRYDFALVIWIVVSKDHDLSKIIDDICNSIGIDWKDKSKDEKVKEIYNVMKLKKFLLMLDDMWETLVLDSIGVPLPNETNHSKVLFTTRFENICDQMQASKFEVKCLTEEQAFVLFCMKVGEETINSEPTILDLARELIQDCKGLPLALITIGCAMAGRKNPQSWKDALRKLKSFPAEVKGMEEEVFFILKFSYDSLPNETLKNCFLYLALFPEDQSIFIRNLIFLWIGEGFLGEHDSIDDAFNHGQDLVESLKFACLVEDDNEDFIKVHDVIRDMALWLIRDQDQNKNKIMVQHEALKSLEGDNLIVERISIMKDGYHDEGFWNLPVCPCLVTLIVRGSLCVNDLTNMQSMNKLKVLSLKKIKGITTLSAEIGKLIHLEYLELSFCNIQEKFSIEMKNLKRLKVFILLELGHSSLEIIPLEVISCLKKLRVFYFSFSSNPGEIFHDFPHEYLFLEQLESLPHLGDISITLVTPSGFSKLLTSAKLQRCVSYVRTHLYGRTIIHTPITLSAVKLERLWSIALYGLPNSLEVSLVDKFCKLKDVFFSKCHLITHLTWLRCAPHLRSLYIWECDLLEEVIMETEDNKGRENMDGIFANLGRMGLEDLPNLRSIYKKALPFPKLQEIRITRCPNIKKLPFDYDSAKNLSTIQGEGEWWNNLEWEDSTIKHLFHPKFEAD